VLSSNPLTASIDIQKTAVAFEQSSKVTGKAVSQKNLGEFADDILNISTLAHEKQQAEVQLHASQEINEIANDVIRVSSSIGRARTLGSLTNSQATSLYNKIAALL